MRLAAYHNFLGRALAILALLVAVCGFLYGFFLLEAVAHAAGRATAERSATQLEGEVARLESEYLALTRGLTPGRAVEMGLVEPAARTTVRAAPAPLSLSAGGTISIPDR